VSEWQRGRAAPDAPHLHRLRGGSRPLTPSGSQARGGGASADGTPLYPSARAAMPRQDVGVPDRRRMRRRWSLPGSLARLGREDTPITPHLIPPRAISRVDRDRGTPHGAAPPTPPGIRVAYHGGSIGLSGCRNIESGETE
jgi:hypothetical protein